MNVKNGIPRQWHPVFDARADLVKLAVGEGLPSRGLLLPFPLFLARG